MRALVVSAPDDFDVRDVERPRPGRLEVLYRAARPRIPIQRVVLDEIDIVGVRWPATAASA